MKIPTTLGELLQSGYRSRTVKEELRGGWVGGLRATWGSRLFADHVPAVDELPIARLRAAGAVVLGKTNTPEFAMVGHTDNQGAWDANLSLAQRRAEAVVAALVGTQAIDAKRLAPRAAASMAPVASNRADAGRAKNRRVELVEQ